MKICNQCKTLKNLSDYYIKSNNSYYSICKFCKNQNGKNWHLQKSKDINWRINRSEKQKKRYYENKIISQSIYENSYRN
jgi:hypothetical protein